MIDLTNRNRTLPMRWQRKCNGKLYGMGDIHTTGTSKLYVWMYEDNSNRCLRLPLERVLRTFKPA